MSNYILSICFNYYKRKKYVLEAIENLLLCKDQRLQVVLYDDSENDDMKYELEKFADYRTKYVKTMKHRGMAAGMVECIASCDGLFGLYSTELEMFDYLKISEFIDVLEANRTIAGGICSQFSDDTGFDIYNKGTIAINHLAYQYQHPTGYFFNTIKYRKLEYKKFFRVNKYGYFPLDHIFGEILLHGDGMHYKNTVWYAPCDRALYLPKEHSYTTINKSTAWFMLEGRIKLLRQAVYSIEHLELENKEKNKILINVYGIMCEGVSIVLRGILANDILCEHYYIKGRYLNNREAVRNIACLTKNFWRLFSFDQRKLYLVFRSIIISFRTIKLLIME